MIGSPGIHAGVTVWVVLFYWSRNAAARNLITTT
jgi:hypothetical protein